MATKKGAAAAEAPAFEKKQLAACQDFREQADLVNALLEDGKLPSHDFSVSEQPDWGCLRHHNDDQIGQVDDKTPRLPRKAGTERSFFLGCCLGGGRDRHDA